MFSEIRKRLTYANLAMTLALVFAMTGGAYAAKHYLITSTKQISPKVLKELKGKNGTAGSVGSAGPAGPAGPVGPAGPAGSPGTKGADGGPGEGVTSKEVKTTEAACSKLGGSSFTVAGKTEYACNGSPWVAGALPKGATETGTWEDQNVKQANVLTSVPISFPVPLKAGSEPTPHYIEPTEVEEGKLPSGCKGTPAKPEAEEGNLCVFADFPVSVSQVENPQFFNPGAYLSNGKLEGNLNGVSPYGTVLALKTSEPIAGLGETAGRGTWAVTGD